MAFVAAPASADPGAAPFDTVTGTVTAGNLQYFSGPPVTSPHAGVALRISADGPLESVCVMDVNGEVGSPGVASGCVHQISARGVAWSSGVDPITDSQVSYAPGDTPELQVDASGSDQDVSFSVEFFDVPPVPVSYSGTSLGTPSPYYGCCSGQDESTLPFVAPATGTYVADVSLSGGTIALSGGVTNQTSLRQGSTRSGS